jgi:hypothetical protein
MDHYYYFFFVIRRLEICKPGYKHQGDGHVFLTSFLVSYNHRKLSLWPVLTVIKKRHGINASYRTYGTQERRGLRR